eukprot:scaffold105074_cov42-Phaeocystis_antarctica.AAC.1
MMPCPLDTNRVEWAERQRARRLASLRLKAAMRRAGGTCPSQHQRLVGWRASVRTARRWQRGRGGSWLQPSRH